MLCEIILPEPDCGAGGCGPPVDPPAPAGPLPPIVDLAAARAGSKKPSVTPATYAIVGCIVGAVLVLVVGAAVMRQRRQRRVQTGGGGGGGFKHMFADSRLQGAPDSPGFATQANCYSNGFGDQRQQPGMVTNVMNPMYL